MKVLKSTFVALWAKLSATFPLNRVILLASPILVTLSGKVWVWAATEAPWVAQSFTQAQLTAVFIAGGIAGITAIYVFLNNLAKMQREDKANSLFLLDTPALDDPSFETTVEEDIALAKNDKPGVGKKAVLKRARKA